MIFYLYYEFIHIIHQVCLIIIPKYFYSIDKAEFEIYASVIERIFCTESSATYYTPFRIENGKRFQACGKLEYHFQYVKGKLRESKILKPRIKSSTTPEGEKISLSFEG